MRARRRALGHALPLGGLALVLVLGAIAGGMQARENAAAQRERFERATDRVAHDVRARMDNYERGVGGARGAVIAAADALSRERFRRYAESRDLAREFPGANGFGFIRRVPEEQEAALVASSRAEGRELSIRSLGAHEGDRFVIQYIEPLAGNDAAIGLDIASEPHRRRAAEHAARTGASTLTAPVDLVQATSEERRGFLMLLPVYEDGMPSAPEERLGATVGWAYAALIAGRVLADRDYESGELAILIDDETPGEAPLRAFTSGEFERSASTGIEGARTLELFGRRWTLRTRATPAFVARLRLPSPLMVGSAVTTLGALVLFAVLAHRRDLSRRLEHAQSRLAAQAALRASEQRFRDLAESIPHLVWTCDGEGACDYLSPQWVRYTGVPEAEQLGDRWLARLHPDDVEGTRTAWAAAAAQGSTFDVQFRIRRHDGAYRWFQTRAIAIRDESGRIARWYGSNTDIQDLREMTELARARSQVATLTERLQIATSAASIGVWDWDVEQNALVWDETMHRLYETNAGEFGGAYEAWKSRVHPDDLETAEAELGGALNGTSLFDTVFRIVCPGGRVKHLRASAELQKDAAGRPIRLVGVNWDVTDQRVAELALRNSEALQRGILAYAGPGLIATDLSGTITLFNRAAEEMLGYAASEVIHRATPVLIHVPEEIEARRAALERELGAPIESPFDVFVIKSRGGKPDANEWTYVRKDGSRLPVLLTVSSLLDDDDALIGYLGVAVDLTERKRQERELVELNRLLAERSAQAESASQAKSMFLASMSHEIRTPMNAITGAAYLLGRSELSADQRELLGTVQTATQSLLAMVNDILDLSKIEAGQLALESAPFDLELTMQSLRSLVSGLASQKQLSLVIELDEAAPRRVSGDGARLAQVLTNLLSNAIKFADHGTVRLSTKSLSPSDDERAWLLFEVTDEGPGIAPDVVPRLFSAFTQGPGARRVGGTGLGLAIVKELVTLMGGVVGVDTAPGAGSRFWCRIPFASVADDVGRPTPPPPADGSARLRGARILVVDDSRINQRIARRILELEGASVELLGDGRSAVERVASSAPLDLVLMDVQMSEMDGLEATRRIRASGSAMPVIALTAGALASERAAALAAGMSDFVTKPFQPDALIGVVRRHLAHRAREGSARELRDEP